MAVRMPRKWRLMKDKVTSRLVDDFIEHLVLKKMRRTTPHKKKFHLSVEDKRENPEKAPGIPPIQRSLPEIILLINEFLNRADSVCLALTCKRLYDTLYDEVINPFGMRLSLDERHLPHAREQELTTRYPERWLLVQHLARDDPDKWRACHKCVKVHGPGTIPEDIMAVLWHRKPRKFGYYGMKWAFGRRLTLQDGEEAQQVANKALEEYLNEREDNDEENSEEEVEEEPPEDMLSVMSTRLRCHVIEWP
jgi:hypothetical protein